MSRMEDQGPVQQLLQTLHKVDPRVDAAMELLFAIIQIVRQNEGAGL